MPLFLGVGPEVGVQHPLKLGQRPLRLERAMVPAKHRTPTSMPQGCQTLPEGSLDQKPRTKEVALLGTIAAKAHRMTVGFVVLSQPLHQSGVAPLAMQQENTVLAVLHPIPKLVRIPEQILHFDLSQ